MSKDLDSVVPYPREGIMTADPKRRIIDGTAGPTYLQHKIIPSFVDFVDLDGAPHRTNVASIADVMGCGEVDEPRTRIYVRGRGMAFTVKMAFGDVLIKIEEAIRGTKA